ncbi:MAG: hypothetical protein ACYC1D_00750 [Acidimicrobiales bacterium]
MLLRRALALLLVVGLCASAEGCGLFRSALPPTSTTRATFGTRPGPLPTTTTTTIDPGLLGQTSVEPAIGPPLYSRMQVLWQSITSDQVDSALPLFFPESAYQKMKTGLLPDPTKDYHDRLLALYRLDLRAYHASLGPGVVGATLLGVSAASADAAWIPPGSCENLIGYWHLPGVRLVYREAGITRSFAVASLISWRGDWYVVHLGPNPRSSDVGTVDQPALGTGAPGPPGGC